MEQLATLAQQVLQQAALGDVDVVGGRIVHVHVGRLGRPVIAPALDLVHVLVQRAAQRDIDLLQTAADREQRDAALDELQLRLSSTIKRSVQNAQQQQQLRWPSLTPLHSPSLLPLPLPLLLPGV